MTVPVVRMGRLLAPTVSAVLALTLTGCTEEDSATQPPSTPPSTVTNSGSTVAPTGTPTMPEPVPPTLPATAKGLTVSSADAFARFYLQAIDHAAGTGDVSVLQAWSDPGCVGCSDLATDFKTTYAKGGSLTGDFHSRNVRVISSRLIDDRSADVTLTSVEGRQIYRPSKSAPPTTYQGENATWKMSLAARSGTWTMFEVVQL